MATIPEQPKIRLARVLSVEDEQAGGRIQVRFVPEDDDIKDDKDLPFCFPLVPKIIHCIPKVNETVAIVLLTAAKGVRFYVGPMISQLYALPFDPYNYQSRVFLGAGNIVKPLPNPNTNPENDGSYPDVDDIALQGRNNADLILKDSEVRLRCGFKKQPKGPAKTSLLFNREDLSYILMRYRKSKDQKGKDYSSSINLVADRINLLSHDSSTPFPLNDTKELITDEAMLEILKKAHPLVYGDLLVQFLKGLINVIRTHTHPFPMDPPSFTTQELDVLGTNLESMLSKAVRTN